VYIHVYVYVAERDQCILESMVVMALRKKLPLNLFVLVLMDL